MLAIRRGGKKREKREKGSPTVGQFSTLSEKLRKGKTRGGKGPSLSIFLKIQGGAAQSSREKRKKKGGGMRENLAAVASELADANEGDRGEENALLSDLLLRFDWQGKEGKGKSYWKEIEGRG